jgi:epoxyqueuosine reductase
MGKAVIDTLRKTFIGQGKLIAFCTLSALGEVRREIESRRTSGEIAEAIYQKYLCGFEYVPPKALPEARSILLIAAPIGRSVIELDLSEGHREAIIPPTYGADEMIEENEAILGPALKAVGSGFCRAWVPNKNLVARTGLASYGRDNILRFPGLGSFVRVDAWWTELSAEGEAWGPARKLERCASCGACARACPNGCFTDSRFIVDATKCLTFMNEGAESFPSWLDPAAHNAAVGCLRCQEACPENRSTRGREVYRRFALSRKASERLLAGEACGDLSEVEQRGVEAVLRASEMVGAEAKLGRNLRALVAAQKAGH